MAITNLTVAQVSGAKLFQDTDSVGTVVAVSASAATIYQIEIDNTANAAATYVKMWDLGTGSVTLGTTAPSLIIPVPASSRITLTFTSGLAFATAVSLASVTAGGTAGTTSPTSDVIVRIVYA